MISSAAEESEEEDGREATSTHESVECELACTNRVTRGHGVLPLGWKWS
jgi:hypothetical protein